MDWGGDDKLNFGQSSAVNEKTPEPKKKASTGLNEAISSGSFSSSNVHHGQATRVFASNGLTLQRRAGNTKDTAYSSNRFPAVHPIQTVQTAVKPAIRLGPPGQSLRGHLTTPSVVPPTVPSSSSVSPRDLVSSGAMEVESTAQPQRTSRSGSKTHNILQDMTAHDPSRAKVPGPVVHHQSKESRINNRSPADPLVALGDAAVGKPTPGKRKAREAVTKSKEVVDLLDDEENVPTQVPKVYGKKGALAKMCGLPDRSPAECSDTTNWEDFPCEAVYLGLRRFRNDTMQQRIHVMSGSNACIRLSLKAEAPPVDGDVPSSGQTLQYDYNESIPAQHIQDIQWGVKAGDKDVTPATTAYIAVHVTGGCVLQSVSVGAGGVLDPERKENDKLCPAKYVLVVTTLEVVEKFHSCVTKYPEWVSKLQASKLSSKGGNFPLIHPGCVVVHLNPTERSSAYDSAMKREEKKKRRRSKANYGTNEIDFSNPEDCKVHLVYPIEIDALDAITIYAGDMKRLEPCQYLNDNLIDLKIKHLLSLLPAEKRSRVHAFSCLFYGKLTELNGKDHKAAHSLVARWTKSLNLFDLDFIVFPINLTFHWSVCFLMNPGKLLAKMDEYVQNPEGIQDIPLTGSSSVPSLTAMEIESVAEQQPDRTEDCRLLFLDSLGMHPMGTIAKAIKGYIFHEWETRIRGASAELKSEGGEAPVKAEEATAATAAAPSSPQFNVEKAHAYFNKCIPHYKCEVPRQPNGYDCGVYVIKNVEKVLESWPTSFVKSSKRLGGSYSDEKINKGMYRQADVDLEREETKKLLNDLSKEWERIRREYLEAHPEANLEMGSPGVRIVGDGEERDSPDQDEEDACSAAATTEDIGIDNAEADPSEATNTGSIGMDFEGEDSEGSDGGRKGVTIVAVPTTADIALQLDQDFATSTSSACDVVDSDSSESELKSLSPQCVVLDEVDSLDGNAYSKRKRLS